MYISWTLVGKVSYTTYHYTSTNVFSSLPLLLLLILFFLGILLDPTDQHAASINYEGV